MTDQELIEAYLTLRNKKKEIEARHTTELAPYKANMEIIANAMLRILNERGSDNTKCAAGTAYKTTRTSVTMKDRDEFLNYVIDHAAWDLLTNHVSKEGVEHVIDVTGAPPPGVHIEQEIVVQFRKG